MRPASITRRERRLGVDALANPRPLDHSDAQLAPAPARGADPSPEAIAKLEGVLSRVDRGVLRRAKANVTNWVAQHRWVRGGAA